MFFVLVAVHEAVYAHVCLVGEQVGLEVCLEGCGQGQLLDAVDGRVGRNGPAAELLQGQHWNTGQGEGEGQRTIELSVNHGLPVFL